MKLAIGIGCDRDTSFHTLNRALQLALHEINADLTSVSKLASIDLKSDEQGLLLLAAWYDWPLRFYPAAQLAEVPVPNPSETVRRYVGTPAVAEAAALLVANADIEQLLVEKYKYKGPDAKNATISIAQIRDLPLTNSPIRNACYDKR